jgi:hypothetical protein
MSSLARANQVQELRELLRKRGAGALRGRPGTARTDASVPWLRPGWMEPGSVMEWIASQAGCGAEELAWGLMRIGLDHSEGRPPPQAGVDRSSLMALRLLLVGAWYPPAVARWCHLNRVIQVHPTDSQQALWVIEQGLRSRGVDIVMARVEQLSPVAGRRLKLAAEAGGVRCLLLRDERALRETSVADLRIRVTPQPSRCWSIRRLAIEVLRWKSTDGRLPDETTQLAELDDETGTVHLVSELADSANLSPSPGGEKVWGDPAHVA